MSEKEKLALMRAYGDDYCLQPDESSEFGPHPRTIRSLVKKGLIEPEDEDYFYCEYDITSAGRVALGVTGSLMRKPKRLKTAIRRAIGHFMGETPNLGRCVFTPDKLSYVVWVNDEQQADYGDALMLVDIDAADLMGFEDFRWSCVGALVRDLGFECYADVDRLLVAFWPDDR